MPTPPDRHAFAPFEPDSLVKMRVLFGDHVDDQGPRSEWLWVEPVGGDCYRVANVPFFVRHLGLFDVVIALADRGDLEFVAVAERHCQASVDFELHRWVDLGGFLDSLPRPAVAVEMFRDGSGSACISDLAAIAPFTTQLHRACEAFELYCSCGDLLYEFPDPDCHTRSA